MDLSLRKFALPTPNMTESNLVKKLDFAELYIRSNGYLINLLNKMHISKICTFVYILKYYVYRIKINTKDYTRLELSGQAWEPSNVIT